MPAFRGYQNCYPGLTLVCGNRVRSKKKKKRAGLSINRSWSPSLFICMHSVMWRSAEWTHQQTGKFLPWNFCGRAGWTYFLMFSLFQNMEKVLVPSVTLIVGCGVSSLTLLLLIIIYVSVWRYGFHSLLFFLGKVTVFWPTRILECLLCGFGCLVLKEELFGNEWALQKVILVA